MALLADLDELAKNNERPDYNEVREVKELLTAPSLQIEAINAEIKRLEDQKVQLERTVKRYGCILAPIRRVPSDVLLTIFEHCLPTDRNPGMAATEAPMLLTRICSSWRSIAMASSSLWAQLHIPYRRTSTIGAQHGLWTDTLAMTPVTTIIKVLELRCYAVQEWLSRSGSCPLSISITYVDSRTELDYGKNEVDMHSVMLLDILVMFSERWKKLELQIPMEIYHRLEEMISGRRLTLLHQVRAFVYLQAIIWAPSEAPAARPAAVLLRAPSLKRVSVNNPLLTDSWVPSFPHTPELAPCNNLTHLFVSHCTLDICIILLKWYPQLIECSFWTSENLDSSAQDNRNTVPIPDRIYLPHLLSLRIHAPSTYRNIGVIINKILDAPMLQQLGYYESLLLNLQSPLMDQNTELSTSLIGRSSQLKALELDRANLMPHNISALLSAASNHHGLTHLSLKSGPLLGITPAPAFLDPFDLERILHWTLHLCFHVSSRMDTHSHIAVLKKVHISFNRYKKEDSPDLTDEIRIRAVKAGIKLHTNFLYPPETSLKSLSPSFLTDAEINNLHKDPAWDIEGSF